MRLMIRPPQRTALLWVTALLIAFAALLSAPSSGFAAPAPPPGPDRFGINLVKYTAYEWLLVTFKDNSVACEISVDYAGQPTITDVYIDCGDKTTDAWIAQKPCLDPSHPQFCDGYYIYFTGSRPAEHEVAVELPAPSVRLELEDCSPVASLSTSLCESSPRLILTAQEPLAEFVITRIEGSLNGQSFFCDAPICPIRLAPTTDKGVLLEFWAYSSFGDSSLRFTAQVRVTQADFGNPDITSWYVDVLSSQWQGQALASCAQSWGILPPVGGPPAWLATPSDVNDLKSEVPYDYLAEKLIRQGIADASMCPSGGLAPDGGVNACGQLAARPAVTDWQNQFDGLILSIAQTKGVPAQLLKNLFGRESQFWPGGIQAAGDTGLGQLTEKGADTTLFWNPIFYHEFCPLVLSGDACNADYHDLEDENRELLRYSLVNSVNATCAACPLGIDIDRANYSIAVFANTLVANCEQAAQIVWNYSSKKRASQLNISYEDMWKLTLVNYHAGGGCLAESLDQITDKTKINWDTVSTHLTGICRSAVDYVNDISNSP